MSSVPTSDSTCQDVHHSGKEANKTHTKSSHCKLKTSRCMCGCKKLKWQVCCVCVCTWGGGGEDLYRKWCGTWYGQNRTKLHHNLHYCSTLMAGMAPVRDLLKE
jgi:hypothetical protein